MICCPQFPSLFRSSCFHLVCKCDIPQQRGSVSSLISVRSHFGILECNEHHIPNIKKNKNIIMVKQKGMRWMVGHVIHKWMMRKVFKILVGKPEGKRTLGRPMHRWTSDKHGTKEWTTYVQLTIINRPCKQENLSLDSTKKQTNWNFFDSAQGWLLTSQEQLCSVEFVTVIRDTLIFCLPHSLLTCPSNCY